MKVLWLGCCFFSLLVSTAFAANVGITWQDMSTDETGFQVARQINGGTFATLPSCNVGADVQACQDTSASSGVSNCYKAFAYNTAGGSAYSNTACITPVAQAPAPPAMLSCVQMPSSPGLILAMNLNATSGTTAADSSGSNNNGTLTNGPVWVTGGKYAGGLSFDGTNDFVSIPDAASLDLTTAGTLEAWVKFDVVNRWNTLFAKGSANSGEAHNYYLEVSDTNVAYCGIGNGTNYQYVSAPINAVGLWQHLACTWDATMLKIYKNGTLMTSVTRTITPSGNVSPLYLGQVGGNVDRLDGTMDDVRIWNVARTAAEIVTDKDTAIP